MDDVTPELIPRRGRGTEAATAAGRDAAMPWHEAVTKFGDASEHWLTTLLPTGAPHVRPLFAKWVDGSLYVTSNRSAVKGRNLEDDPRCAIAADTGDTHLVIEAQATRVTAPDELERVAEALRDVGWPAEVRDDALDAPFGAPTSGGPPYAVFRLRPRRAHAFPADGESFAPTRWTFPVTGHSTARRTGGVL